MIKLKENEMWQNKIKFITTEQEYVMKDLKEKEDLN